MNSFCESVFSKKTTNYRGDRLCGKIGSLFHISNQKHSPANNWILVEAWPSWCRWWCCCDSFPLIEIILEQKCINCLPNTLVVYSNVVLAFFGCFILAGIVGEEVSSTWRFRCGTRKRAVVGTVQDLSETIFFFANYCLREREPCIVPSPKAYSPSTLQMYMQLILMWTKNTLDTFHVQCANTLHSVVNFQVMCEVSTPLAH